MITVGPYNMISFESIIPDIIPDEKKPFEPPIWNEEYDDEYEDASRSQGDRHEE